MRIPFRRRKGTVPGAKADWDESEHVSVGDDYVAIPLEELPQEAVERLEGVTLHSPPDGSEGKAVLVNIDAVQAEIDAWLEAQVSQGRQPTEDEARAASYAALNNTDYWLKGGVDAMKAEDPDTRWSFYTGGPHDREDRPGCVIRHSARAVPAAALADLVEVVELRAGLQWGDLSQRTDRGHAGGRFASSSRMISSRIWIIS
jgi:hypothetical protein